VGHDPRDRARPRADRRARVASRADGERHRHAIWPLLLGAGALVAILGLLGVARRALLALGLLVIAAGGALLYYVSNVVEIEIGGRSAVEQLLANAVITSSTGPGTPLLIASGLTIVVGALLAR
jgi:hypothetical protein